MLFKEVVIKYKVTKIIKKAAGTCLLKNAKYKKAIVQNRKNFELFRIENTKK